MVAKDFRRVARFCRAGPVRTGHEQGDPAKPIRGEHDSMAVWRPVRAVRTGRIGEEPEEVRRRRSRIQIVWRPDDGSVFSTIIDRSWTTAVDDGNRLRWGTNPAPVQRDRTRAGGCSGSRSCRPSRSPTHRERTTRAAWRIRKDGSAISIGTPVRPPDPDLRLGRQDALVQREEIAPGDTDVGFRRKHPPGLGRIEGALEQLRSAGAPA